MANKSIFDAFERMWQHTVAKLGLKADKAEIQETYETKAAAGDKLAEAKIYTDEAAAAVKDDLLNGAGAAYDTLKELGDLIDENQDALEALETVATGKAEKEHIHAISDVVDLQAKLDSIPELVNSDWNQNDENAADYIKNRPFYETTEVEIEYIPETTLSNFEEEYWSSSNPDTIYYNSRTTTDYYVEFSSDKTYTVIWDGVRYDNVTCESTMGGPMIGSTERQIAGVYGESNQYPFGILMQYIDNSPELYIIAEEEGAHTVKVTSISESYIKTIDFKFLPELVGKYTDTVGHSEIFNDYENNIADGYHSHAEGSNTTAYDCSHAEGCLTVASGEISHAEGYQTNASGDYSHAEGDLTVASGTSSHAEGSGTIAEGNFQHVQGKYNIADNNTYAHIVGNGDWKTASNAHTLDWDGNANFAGDVYVGNANENKAGKKLATEEYVNESSKKLVFDSIQLRDISTGFTYLLQIKDGIIVTSSKVTGISMTTQPNKTTYMVGETVDLTGIVIEAACEDGSVKDVVAGDVTYYPEVITEGVTSIEVKYHSGGSEYIVTVPIRVIASIEELLIDFEYTDNNDGTYTLTGWKQTLNGEPSTEMVIPDNSSIKL